jgi:hypothetical protein
MAERRMFTKKITDGDVFTSMPPTTQCLYFHLCMGADDDGFSNNIRIAMFNAHATTDDFNTLVNKRFILPFESGVIVIKHWKMHNYIQSDRYHETKFLEEKSQLVLKENGVYTECIQDGYKMDTEVSIGKDSIDKNRLDKDSIDNICGAKSKRFVPPTVEEIKDYCLERNNNVDANKFFDFYQAKGWMVGKNKMKDWKACVRTWEKSNSKSGNQPQSVNIVDDWV